MDGKKSFGRKKTMNPKFLNVDRKILITTN